MYLADLYLLFKVTYIAFQVYILSIHAFLSNKACNGYRCYSVMHYAMLKYYLAVGYPIVCMASMTTAAHFDYYKDKLFFSLTSNISNHYNGL